MDTVRQIQCPLCGAADFEILARPENCKYVRCSNCGLAFVDPMPSMTSEDVDELSESTFFRGLGRANGFDTADFNRCQKFERQLRMLRKYKSGGRLLEIGCATGYYLRRADRVGFECYGIEASRVASEYGGRCTNMQMFAGRLQDTSFPSEYFDAVRLCQVLEHLTCPVESLGEVNRIMKRNGILEIGVPNPESLLNSSRNLYHRLSGRFKRDKFSFDLYSPVHLYSFPRDTLRLLLGRTGFSPLRMIVTGSGNRTYEPFVPGVSLRVLMDQLIDMIGKGVGKGSILYVYARKADRSI